LKRIDICGILGIPHEERRGFMKENFAREVYNTLNGYYGPALRVPGVENAFDVGMPCLELYGKALDAYLRICERFGEEEEDEDVEVIFNAFLEISEILGLKMYHYGAMFGEDVRQKV
jgi:hypothetical protein